MNFLVDKDHEGSWSAKGLLHKQQILTFTTPNIIALAKKNAPYLRFVYISVCIGNYCNLMGHTLS